MNAPASLVWLAGHEFSLVRRDLTSLLTGGRRRRLNVVIVALVAIAAVLHLPAYGVVGRFATLDPGNADKESLVYLTGTLLLFFFLMLSQAMDSVTRAFYVRADLDLILSSPVPAARVFAVRIGMIAVSSAAMALLLAAPMVDVLALAGGPRWLSAYGVAAAMGAAATALAVALIVGLFRLLGPKRTRLVAQILAAVVGAAFVIGVQVAAILSTDTMSRFEFLGSAAVIAGAPGLDSPFWWPARAALGDFAARVVLAAGLLLLAAAIALFAPRFGDNAVAAAGAVRGRRRRRTAAFRGGSARQALRRKEWTLLRRDPWLVSQTLMQILYLLPPALLLWRNYSDAAGTLVILVPVLVMAAGQLGGGLAWLAVSGEDAPDLVATAPVTPRQVVRAKTEAVFGGIAIIFAPLLLALALASPWDAVYALAGIVVAVASSTRIQLWFRVRARRSQFRRRQSSSRAATYSEALSSLAWASTAALAAAGTWLALVSGAVALLVLAVTWALSPGAAEI